MGTTDAHLRRARFTVVGLFLVVAIVLALASPALAPAPVFPDVPTGHPYHAAVVDLAGRGIINGYLDGRFGPEDFVLRQQFAKMIVLTCGYPVSELDVCLFTDVAWSGLNGLYPDNYVAVAHRRGITTGKTLFSFGPLENITRFQVISMVMRAADDVAPRLLADPPAGYRSSWDPAVSSEHGPNARRAEYNGLLAGLPLASLDPWAPATRGEVAQILHNLLTLLDGSTTTTTNWLHLDIEDLKGLGWQTFMGQEVEVEGVFVSDPVPMLVTDPDLVRVNTPLPAQSYVLLAGTGADTIDPAVYGGQTLQVRGVVGLAGLGLASLGERWADVPQAQASSLAPVDLALSNVSFLLKGTGPILCPHVFGIDISYSPSPDRHKHAILFSGGVDFLNAHVRYWNDLKFMYSTLVGPLGFPADQVTVLYANGFGLDLTMPVDGPGTGSALASAFANLRRTTGPDDLIFVMFTNHGGGFNTDPSTSLLYGGAWDQGGDEPGEALREVEFGLDLNGDGDLNDTVSWDEELCAWQPIGGTHVVLDDELGRMMSGLEFSRLAVLTGTCFGGGLLFDMAQGGNRILMSSAGEHEFSWSRDDLNFCEFSCNFTSALRGHDPEGNPVDADQDGDGAVSLVEAYSYAQAVNTRPETPHYEDSGDGIAHAGAIPGHGEGALGMGTWLGKK